ncbi:MAG TPA: DinB family protein [Blastocatellia bacterium]|nr:DinB family protein [Blastocatellia bacterium]
MNDLVTTRELFAYSAWADALVWSAVLGDANASSDARVRDYLFHTHLVQNLFLKVWRGDALEAFPKEPPPLASILALAQSTYGELTPFLRELGEQSLGAIVKLPWAGMITKGMGKEPAASTLGETMLQVVNHSTYHRGQVNSRLRELGGTPPSTDYIAWVLLAKPEAAWPEREP